MDTFILEPSEPLLKGYEDLYFVRCRARRRDHVLYHDCTPCEFSAIKVIDGVACCGIHARQIKQCKDSPKSFLPMWFIRAVALSPAEAKLLIGSEQTPSHSGSFVGDSE